MFSAHDIYETFFYVRDTDLAAELATLDEEEIAQCFFQEINVEPSEEDLDLIIKEIPYFLAIIFNNYIFFSYIEQDTGAEILKAY